MEDDPYPTVLSCYAHQMTLERPLRDMPPWPTTRGRPVGAAYALNAREFKQRVIALIRLLEKDGTPANKPRLSAALHISLSTLHRYYKRFSLDHDELLQKARAP